MASSIVFDVNSVLPARGPVALIAHDAGAATHIAAWFSSCKLPLHVYFEGPAKALVQKIINCQVEDSFRSAIEKSSVVVTGTGWASDLEHKARQYALSSNKPCVAVLDHWVNYQSRFWREGKKCLPNILWVSDAEASDLAKASFPSLPVLQLPNIWLDSLCISVKTIRNNKVMQPIRPARRLLYLLEPIRSTWDQDCANKSEEGEFQALRYWLGQLPRLIAKGHVAPASALEVLALRPHPSEPLGKYDQLISDYSSTWPIRLDTSKSLAESLALADAAFGCETQALVAALACHVPSFSTIPPVGPPCRLPHASLHHLSRLEDV